MKYYEGMFVLQNKEARKDTDYLADHVKGIIEKTGGKIHQMTKWDERRLAYPIKGVTHGVYYLLWFTGESDTDAKMRHEVRLSNLVLRHLTLSLEKFPEGNIENFSEMQTRLAGAERRPGGEMDEAVPAIAAVVDGEPAEEE